MAHPDVAVVGGGVIELSVAYHAARRGARVTLLEAGDIGDGASGAAAGMLNAQAESDEPGPFLDLQLKGREAHRPLAARLYEETGLDPEYVWAGTLRVARTEQFEERLAEAHSWQREQGLPAEWLDGGSARELEPALPGDVRAALYLQEEGQVNPGRLVRALALAAINRGAEIHEGPRVTGLRVERARVIGVETAGSKVAAGSVVLAGGAESAGLVPELGLELPVYPIKGETLAIQTASLPVRANVWDEGCYLVPKRDGRVIVGATERPDEWDRRPTLSGLARLSDAAWSLAPALSEAPVVNLWGGLRPGTPSGQPVLGPVEGVEGLLLATGHNRNGVLLSAITGEAVSALALGYETPVDLAPFGHERHLQSVS